MIPDVIAAQVYLAYGSTDMRKSMDGLAVLVKESFHLDPFSNARFGSSSEKTDEG